MSENKKILVTNIPIRGFIEGYVSITQADAADPIVRDNAIRVALLEGRYSASEDHPEPYSIEVETEVLESGWDFATPLETD
jgi:hypothetical protein